ncbi:MAG: cell division protein FtsA [Armatimonadetes bacterium]|nr:cell division protein FtsA [Armatimonadota bacterium]
MAVNQVPLIVGLDIGTTKVCTLVGILTEDHKVEVRGIGIAPSVGLRKGVIVDLGATSEAIRRSGDEAARMCGLPLTSAHVYVGVTGDHVDSFVCHGAVTIDRPDHDILPADVDRVKAMAVNGVQTATRDILLERPREFSVDGQRGISDPVHMSGERLEVDLHVVTGEHRFLDQVRQCVDQAGLPVDSLILEAVATGEAVLTADERKLGCAVLDLGGGTTDVAVYLDGELAHTSAIPVGGAHVTFDLSYGLQAPYQKAEDIKVRYACAQPELCDPDGVIQYVNVRGEQCEAEHAFLAEVVGPRMEELFELVGKDLYRAGIDLTQLGAGVVLTGGASRLTGTLAVARNVLGVLVREAQPIDVVGHAARVAGPQFSTGVGLVRIGGMDQLKRIQHTEETSFIARMRTFWRNFTRLFD